MNKVIISSDVLKKALKKLSLAISKKPVLLALSNLYFRVNKAGEIELITTDLELTIICKCLAETTGTFEMLLPFEFLNKIISLTKLMPIEIELVNEKQARITGVNDVYDLTSLDPVSDFAKLPDVPKKNTLSLGSNILSSLNRAMATIAMDPTRPALSKACLDIETEGVKVVSTDAHMFYMQNFAMAAPVAEQLLISPKMAKALEGFDDAEIAWTKKQIAVKCGDVTVMGTRHEDKYPNYKAVIPSYGPNLILNRMDLLEALEKSCLSGLTTHIHLKKDSGKIHFETMDLELNRKTTVDIAGNYDGPVDAIVINSRHLSTLLNQVDFEEVRLHIHNSHTAILISAEADESYLGLLMPLMINQ